MAKLNNKEHDLERDEDGLLKSYRCERLQTVNGELLCDGMSGENGFCDCIESMKEGKYYDCILIE